MSEYNAKNYTEQGGEVTHIGGQLVFDEGAGMSGFPGVPNQALVEGSQVKDVKESLNQLITAMKNAGLMIPDEWDVTVTDSTAASLHDMPTANTLSNSNHATLTIDGRNILITLDCDVDDLKDCDHGETWGTHKWLGFGVDTGLLSIVGVVFNDGTAPIELTSADVDEAEAVGLPTGCFILYVKAEKIYKQGGFFTLNADGFAETEFAISIAVNKN